MATKLGLLSMTHLHKLTQNQDQDQDCQLNPNTSSTSTTTSTVVAHTTAATTSASWMWNPKRHQEASEEDSWEVRAFAEDTGSVMGTTWPPRSYTCAFCRREFRSAQALGGHMNVHRRDRARLHQVIPPNSIISHPAATVSAASSTAASSFLIPAREFVAGGGGLCLLYQLPNPSNPAASAATAAVFTNPASFAACSAESASQSPSTLLSISPYPQGNLAFPASGNSSRRSRRDHRPTQGEEQLESGESGGHDEELDLELRLGHGPTPS